MMKSFIVTLCAVIMLLAMSIPAFAAESIMPETGGIGTTIFYTVGGILMVGAVILLVTKKRMK